MPMATLPSKMIEYHFVRGKNRYPVRLLNFYILLKNMPMAGVEPARGCPHKILSLARLPISSHRHIFNCQMFVCFSDEIGWNVSHRLHSRSALHHIGIFLIVKCSFKKIKCSFEIYLPIGYQTNNKISNIILLFENNH